MSTPPAPQTFKAEIRQLLDILIHSLYTEREIFLRELISNASDALNRVRFQMLTEKTVLDPEAELCIRLSADPEKRQLIIEDSGIGMTSEELAENLGTIARSGARAFLFAAQQNGSKISDIIGQFGVGFYSVFMVAEKVRVLSRSWQPEAQAAVWEAEGGETYTLQPAEKATRGTRIEITLKEDAAEFAQDYRLRDIVRKHSDFVAFPIYLGESTEKINQQKALWRENPRDLTEAQYHDFYKQLTLDFNAPLTHLHIVADAPVQVYAALFVPAKAERGIFSLRKEDGLKLYARKILIKDYTKDLLPEYLRFVQGVVDSEDLPLNVSRESIQANPMIGRIKKMLTGKVLGALKELALKDPEKYTQFWLEFGRYLKEGIATTPEERERDPLLPLLRFRTNKFPQQWSNLAEYVGRMNSEQRKIYYLLADDERSALRSPHLDYFVKKSYEVILLTEPIDSFMLTALRQYEGFDLQNVAAPDSVDAGADGDSALTESAPPENFAALVERFKTQLGSQVSEVRASHRLSDSVARLVDPEGSLNPEMQRVYRMLEKEYEVPKKVLELNPRHPIIHKLAALPAESPLAADVIQQIYESALLIEGLHPEPASMLPRIQSLIAAALGA
ncbi:MAG: molecular chaperone HtpG [Anaerolineales bacterium]